MVLPGSLNSGELSRWLATATCVLALVPVGSGLRASALAGLLNPNPVIA